MTAPHLMDPYDLFKLIWPHLSLYDKQREILRSVWDNVETVVPAGHQLGKDFISGVISILFYRSRMPCRIITTSVQGQQLCDVLWGEIRWLLREAKVDLNLQYNHLHIRQMYDDGSYVEKSELRGKTVDKGESLAGYHLPRCVRYGDEYYDGVPTTLAIFDEASGISDTTYESTLGWSHRRLIIGNPYPCENFFKRLVTKGDMLSKDGTYYQTKIIEIGADHSPNVRLARKEIALGKKPSNKILVPGVIGLEEVEVRLKTWDKQKIDPGIYGKFYEGEEVKLFPQEWLEYSWELWRKNKPVIATGLGADTAEGGDKTCFSAAGDEGLVKLTSKKTKDTSEIPGMTLELMREFNILAMNVYFDQGGGGKEHADLLRANGFKVKTIFFGSGATKQENMKRRWKSKDEIIDIQETRTTFKNMRAELYHVASAKVNPAYGGYALPPPETGPQYEELYRQLKVMPKLLDEEGRYYLPPKKKRPNTTSKVISLEEMLGHSPDEADSFVLSIWAVENIERRVVI